MLKINNSFRLPKPNQKERKTHIVSIAGMAMGMHAVSGCNQLVLMVTAIILGIAMFACLKLMFKELKDVETNKDCMLSYYVMKYFVGICIQSVLTLLVLTIMDTTG